MITKLITIIQREMRSVEQQLPLVDFPGGGKESDQVVSQQGNCSAELGSML